MNNDSTAGGLLPGRYQIAITINALLTSLGAALHIWWHWKLPGLQEMAGLSTVQWGLLNTLNLSIAAVLTMFACLSLMIASGRVFALLQVRVLSILMAAFYLTRLVIEILNPVRVPLLPVPTSPALIVLLLLGIGSLLLPLVLDSRHATASTP